MHTFRVKGGSSDLTTSANFGLPRFTVVLASPWKILAAWAARREERLALSRLSTKMLQDIGVSARDADEECKKPFWQP